MSLSYAVLVIWALFEGLNDINFHTIDAWVRGVLLLLFFVLAVLEATGYLKFRLPARRAE